MDRGGILVLYPEARYANVGTSSPLPPSTAKLIRYLKVPVVTINMKGNYLQSPIWNLKKRKGVRLEADVQRLLTAEETGTLPLETIQQIVEAAFTYDEYAWQAQQGMVINVPWRAEGLGGLEGPRFSRIPDWYEWERSQVEEEIQRGTYTLDLKVRVQSLPNAVNFIGLGEGRLRHGPEGFALTFTDYGAAGPDTLRFPARSTFSIHTEYDYRGQGECITLSTPDNTYFLYPLEPGFSATKLQFAAEALWRFCN